MNFIIIWIELLKFEGLLFLLIQDLPQVNISQKVLGDGATVLTHTVGAQFKTHNHKARNENGAHVY